MNHLQTALIALSSLVGIIVVERLFNLYFKKNTNIEKDLNQIAEFPHRTAEDFNRQLDKVMTEYMSKVEARIGWLAMLGNAITVLSFGALMFQIIDALGKINDQTSPELRKQILEVAIGQSLRISGLSFVVALVSLVMYSIFNNRANVLIQKMGKASCEVYVKVMSGDLGIPQ